MLFIEAWDERGLRTERYAQPMEAQPTRSLGVLEVFGLESRSPGSEIS